MTTQTLQKTLGTDLAPGVRHYRAFVGPTENYDLVAAMQFNLLTFLGLREHHCVLDVGCGSLRAGKLLIPYLLPEHYFGIEPEQWLIEEGIEKEVGEDMLDIKRPVFSNENDFALSTFARKFDFILAQSIFSHTSQTQIMKCFSEAKRVMKPTSVFAATFCEGDDNYTGNGWVYPDCVTYTADVMIQLAAQSGLVCKPIGWPHPNRQTWMLIVHPSNEDDTPGFADIADLFSLRQQLALCRDKLEKTEVDNLARIEDELKTCRRRLAKFERHPCVKLGMKINRGIGQLRLWRS